MEKSLNAQPSYISSEQAGSDEQRAKLRRTFGFGQPEQAQSWRCAIELDALMGAPSDSNPHLASALLHPLARHAEQAAQRAFEHLSDTLADHAQRMPIDLRRGSIERKSAHAFVEMESIGLDTHQAEALMARAFLHAAMGSAESMMRASRIEPLSDLCKFPLRCGSNAILAEQCVGTLAAWLFAEATQLRQPRDICLALPWDAASSLEPPLVHWTRDILARLDESWMSQGSSPSPIQLRRIHALLALSDSCQGTSAPLEFPRIRSLAERQDLAACLPIPHARPPTSSL